MIDIPVHNQSGQPVGTLQIDEQLLGGEIRHALLKQAFVRQHANQRLGTSKTKDRGEVSYSTKKLYRQKGTGNARRGSRSSNTMRGGAHGQPKKPHSWRQDMPKKMRRLANRNALLAKAVDNEIKVIDAFQFDKPDTQAFASLLTALKIDRSCLFALADTRTPIAKSARNLSDITLTQVDRLCVFDLLNHRYLLVDQSTLQGWLDRAKQQLGQSHPEVADAAPGVAASAKEAV
jgi:large subunit ribosomal protein L4